MFERFIKVSQSTFVIVTIFKSHCRTADEYESLSSASSDIRPLTGFLADRTCLRGLEI